MADFPSPNSSGKKSQNFHIFKDCATAAGAAGFAVGTGTMILD